MHTSKISHVRAVVDREDRVVGWRFRWTLSQGPESIFDDFSLTLDRPTALASWSPGSVRQCLEDALGKARKARELERKLADRVRMAQTREVPFELETTH